MTEVAAIGFWSYAHGDDAAESGRIVRLRQKIQAEYEMLTGTQLNIVVDQERLRWGHDFRDRLESAIEETTFFIPILTESYFLSEECRKEFQQFVGTARKLGLERLLMSIRYAPVRDLREDSKDQLKALAARMQYADWNELRLEDETSGAYRKGVHNLAQRLAELTTEAETLLPRLPSSRTKADVATPGERDTANIEDEDAPGWLDIVVDFPEKSQAWIAQIQKASESMLAVTAPFTEWAPQLDAANKQTNPFAAKVRITRELAKVIEDPLQEFERDAQEYVAKLADLDPIVQAMLAGATLSYSSENSKGLEGIASLVDASQETMGKLTETAKTARKYQGMSKDLRPLLRRYETGLRNMVDAQWMIDGWGALMEAAKLDA